MVNDLILLQREDLKELIAEAIENVVGKNCQTEQPSSDEGEYYTRGELCARLHITYTTLWRMEKRGDINVYKIGRRNLYAKRDVEALISQSSAETNNK